MKDVTRDLPALSLTQGHPCENTRLQENTNHSQVGVVFLYDAGVQLKILVWT